MVSSDAELVRRCLQGDNTAFDELVKNYQKPVFSFCYRMLGDADESADVAQESFLKAYHALPSFRLEASFLTWMFKIAGNTCIDRSRARKRHSGIALDDLTGGGEMLPSSDPSPEDSSMRGESDRLLREAILRLPDTRRAALVMFYFNGLRVDEISAVTGRPVNTIKSDLRKAREQLRRKLEGIVVSR